MSRPAFQNGFTIVELLVVVVVVAILATIVVVSYNGITRTASETAVKTDATSAAKQLELAKTIDGCFDHTNLFDYLSKQYGDTTIEYQYGDTDYFCLNVINASKNLQYHIESKDGISAVKSGLCPATYTNATANCLLGNARVSVYIQNQTGGTITATYSAPTANPTGQGVHTLNAGQSLSVSISTSSPSITHGIGRVVIEHADGTTYTRYHHHDAINCA